METAKPNIESTTIFSVLNKDKVYGLPLTVFAILSVIVFFAAYSGKLPTDYVGIIAFLMVLGGIFFYIGGKIPIFNEYMGGSVVLPLFVAGALATYNFIPDYVDKAVGGFMKGGFPNLFIAAVLVGSILSLNRKTLLRSVYKYLPTIIGSQAVAIAFLALAGVITGVGVFEAIFLIGAPTMAGGTGGAVVTLPAVYSNIMNVDASKYAGAFLGYNSISNVISILSAAVLAKVLVNSKTLNGHGRLLMDETTDDILTEESRPSSDKDYAKLGAGLLLALTFMVAGQLISVVLPQIVSLAWVIIIAIIVKATGLISDELCDYTNYWFNFTLKNLLPALIVGIGITSMDITILGKFFTLKVFFVIIMGILGAAVGAAFFGRLFKLWPLEASITAAFCSTDCGGSGDIAILSASNRLHLLPFASISTRIGGALMILEISFLMPLFLK